MQGLLRSFYEAFQFGFTLTMQSGSFSYNNIFSFQRLYLIPFCEEFAPNKLCIVKERFKKTYRHPNLDRALTSKRTVSECRIATKLYKSGLTVPRLFLVDTSKSLIYMEYVEGPSVRDWLLWMRKQAMLGSKVTTVSGLSDAHETKIATLIGTIIAKLHSANVVHGDLTSSNMLIPYSGDDWERVDLLDLVENVCLIDFGLSQTSTLAEDMGVDLYVLERAMSSTHPHTERMFEKLLQVYKQNTKYGGEAVKRYEMVRQRGRKKLAFG